MNRQTIEKAAEEYSYKQWEAEKDFECRDCMDIIAPPAFVAGADWRINSVWHDATEKPDKNQLVVFECRKTYGRGYSVNFGENYDLLNNVVLKWAYVIDLLPERKEETK